MNAIVKHALRSGLVLALFVCLAWSVIACGNGDDQRTEPNQDATTVAATVEAVLDAIATAEAAEASAATPVPTPQPSPMLVTAPIVLSDPGSDPGGRGCRNRWRCSHER